jgi:hypothetical protein
MTRPDARAGQADVPGSHPTAPLRGLPALDTEPPYDDEADARDSGSGDSSPGSPGGSEGVDGRRDGGRPPGPDADGQACGIGGESAPRPHVGRRALQTGGRRGPGTTGSSHGRGARPGVHRGPGDGRLPAPPPSPAASLSRSLPRPADDVSLRTVSGRAAVTAQPATRRPPVRIPPQARDSRLRENPAPAATIVARAIVEVLAGVRPVAHLSGWATPRLQAALERFGGQYPRGSVRSIRISEPRPGVAEVVAVVNRGDRVAALALRMVSVGGRWQVTNLQIG